MGSSGNILLCVSGIETPGRRYRQLAFSANDNEQHPTGNYFLICRLGGLGVEDPLSISDQY